MRAAVFVDVGYLYTGGSTILTETGTKLPRSSIELRPQENIAQLKTFVDRQTDNSPLLRIYWYDGLLQGRRSSEQDQLAMADDVKLRLGTVTGGRQKGVDSLIVTDLIELARNHAISDAVLLSGDEDLRIGVQIAQSFGVRVHLIGIETTGGNQSKLLREESDSVTEWSRKEVANILSVKASGTAAVNVGLISDQVEAIPNEAIEILTEVSKEVADSISADELAKFNLKPQSSPIPRDYDSKLLSESRNRLGRDLDLSERRSLRDLFRENLRCKFGGGS